MLTIYIYDLPPMFRNRSHMVVANPRPMLVKTSLCREFEKDLTNRLLDFVEPFAELKKSFNQSTHYIKATYYIYTPENLLFTKEGCISSRSGDTDAHKIMRDVLYRSIGVDDKVERSTLFFTPVSKSGNWDYVITLEIRPKSELYV